MEVQHPVHVGFENPIGCLALQNGGTRQALLFGYFIFEHQGFLFAKKERNPVKNCMHL